MPEHDLIEFIRQLAAGEEPSWLCVGIGDDAAVVELTGGERIIVTADMVIEGVHVAEGVPPRVMGRKAAARALSDVAAMAARPLCMVATTSIGAGLDEAGSRELVEAIWQAARELGCPLVGGDVASTDGHTCVAVTAIGTPGAGGVALRSGAQPGDALCVTGRLGGSLLGHHLTFRPRIPEALTLAAGADLHALIDISDGLSTDALHLAEASGAGVVIDAAAVPVSEDAVTLSQRTGRDPLWHALNDGEDYELLFCLPPTQAERLAETGVDDTTVTVVGEVTPGPESYLLMADGRREPLVAGGWEHMR